MSDLRATGGNRFIPGDSDRTALVLAVQRGLHDLHVWAVDTGRCVDVGAITVITKRIPSGKISVTVTGDLTTPDHDGAATRAGHAGLGCAPSDPA